MARVGSRSDESLRSVNPVIGTVIREALEAAPPWLDFAVISGWRSVAEQQALWYRGRDASGKVIRPEEVVTYKDGIINKSNHQFGNSVDIAAYENGVITFNTGEVAGRAGYIIGFAAARGIKLSGGLKWDWDLGHIEVV